MEARQTKISDFVKKSDLMDTPSLPNNYQIFRSEINPPRHTFKLQQKLKDCSTRPVSRDSFSVFSFSPCSYFFLHSPGVHTHLKCTTVLIWNTKEKKKNNQTTRSFVGNFVAKSLHSFICKFTWTMNEIQKLILLLRFRSRIENRESESVYNLNCKNELVSFEMRLMKSDKKNIMCVSKKWNEMNTIFYGSR